MNFLRILLFPLAVLYGWITQCRNFLYNIGVLKSYCFNIPLIAVGNLSVGGTGKTPQIEYLIRLLSSQYKIATLSRGYKRKSKGFILADSTANASTLGDEPYQFYKKFPQIQVAVDANRKEGIQKLLVQHNPPEVILLDDAFQHRKVKAGLYILLTAYGDLFCDDYMLPTGHLREPRSGAKRADIIIVTKCPLSITASEQESIKNKIGGSVPLFFSAIAYDEKVYAGTQSVKVSTLPIAPRVLLAGIANPKPFFDYLKREQDLTLQFPDHHHFSESEIAALKKQAGDQIIITTEKDYMRLKSHFSEGRLFYLPIKTILLKENANFDKMIFNYVE